MNKAQLRDAIFATNPAPRDLVVQYVKLLTAEAKALPVDERAARGDYKNPKNKFPQTQGEDIASDITSCLVQQDWIDWDSEPDLSEIESIITNLEINTDDHRSWQDLFELVEKLK